MGLIGWRAKSKNKNLDAEYGKHLVEKRTSVRKIGLLDHLFHVDYMLVHHHMS